MIVLKKIEMTLDEASVERAIREVEHFRDVLKPAMECLIRYLGEKGIEIARAELIFFDQPAYDTGDLSRSIKFRLVEGTGEGVLTAGEGLQDGYNPPQSYAMYVEYGTGVYGADLNNHGPAGWLYEAPFGWIKGRNGRMYAWTMGMPARPFMQNTYNDLIEEAKVAGGRVIAEYIRGERA